MKFAILNDTHCGIRNSSDIFLDNAEKFYTAVFFPYLLENGISHIVHLGDIFDNRKFINFRALQRHRKMFLNKLREYKITMDIIPGNHDTYYKNTNDLNSLKELLGHFTDCINIIMEPTVMNYDGLDFALLPWIAQDNEAKSLDFIKNTKALYLGGHLDITGFEMMKGTVNAHGMSADLFDRFDGVYSGHFHTKSSKNNIHYLGSQMEFFWNDAHDPKYLHFTDCINIIMEPTVMNYDGLDFALLPWIAQDNEAKSLDFIKNTKALYLGGHLDITGFEMMKGTVNAHGMSVDLFDRFDGVYSGHFHTKSSKNNIHYLGSQMEFFWNDAHDPKYFHVFDTNAKQITQVLNPNTLHHRINYDDTRQDYLQYDLSQVENKFVKIVVINKNDLFTFDRFVDRIQARKIHELKIADNFNEFIGSSVNDDEVELEDTTSLLNTYVDAVDTELDKARIKVQMHELMIEAQTMEVV